MARGGARWGVAVEPSVSSGPSRSGAWLLAVAGAIVLDCPAAARTRFERFNRIRRMKGFQEFGTYFIIPPRTERNLGKLGSSRIWRIASKPDPSRRHWCDDSGNVVHVQFDHRSSAYRASGLRPARQLIVLAQNADVASKVASLIRAGALLGYPDLTQYPDVTSVFPLPTTGPELLDSEPFA